MGSAASWVRGALARIPKIKPGIIESPLRWANKSAYESRHSNKEINAGIKAAPIESVPINQLTGIQPGVVKVRVEEFIENPDAVPPGTKHERAGTPVDLPVVIEDNGKKYLHDGHHRTAASVIRGLTRIRARVVRFKAA